MGIGDLFKKLGSKPEQPTQVSTSTSPKTKVLVVEDDDYLRDFYAELLTGAGFEVTKAVNGEDGLNQVKTFTPDVIILDLLMPVMDGKIMLQKLRETPEFKEIPVIILTNQGDVDTVRETQRYGGAIEFLIKSNINPQMLIDKVKTFS